MKAFRLSLFLTMMAGAGLAQTPEWSTDIAPIIYNRCANCHHNGGIAPFSLMSYTDATGNSAAMKVDVSAGIMPPWPPDPTYSHLAHERILSASEKTKIINWVNGGTPSGNLALAPPTPTFSTAGDLAGTPDLSVKIPVYTSPATTGDVYRCFVLPTGLTADKYITAFEAIPGNRGIVHHVLVYADTTGQSTILDNADPGPGYTSFGGIGVSGAIMLGGWVPGTSPLKYPAGFGTRLPKNAKIVVQIHYPAGTAGEVDSTSIHFFLSAAGGVRDVYITPALNHNDNISPALVIPPNTVKSFTEHFLVPLNISLLGLAPHMHLLGQNIRSFGVRPAGDTLKFINVPKWDFHWQGFYLLPKIMKVDAGTNAYALATYDNTSSNPENPSSPPKLVQAGENTTDEMMLVYFIYSFYQAGDENIIIDNTTPTGVNTLQPYYGQSELLQSYPVPAQDKLITKYYLTKSETGSMVLLNLTGQVVRQIFSFSKLAEGYTALPVDVSSLASGNYILQLAAGDRVMRQQVTVQH